MRLYEVMPKMHPSYPQELARKVAAITALVEEYGVFPKKGKHLISDISITIGQPDLRVQPSEGIVEAFLNVTAIRGPDVRLITGWLSSDAWGGRGYSFIPTYENRDVDNWTTSPGDNSLIDEAARRLVESDATCLVWVATLKPQWDMPSSNIGTKNSPYYLPSYRWEWSPVEVQPLDSASYYQEPELPEE